MCAQLQREAREVAEGAAHSAAPSAAGSVRQSGVTDGEEALPPPPKAPRPPRGLFLYGDVGVGKTLVLDLFAQVGCSHGRGSGCGQAGVSRARVESERGWQVARQQVALFSSRSPPLRAEGRRDSDLSGEL